MPLVEPSEVVYTLKSDHISQRTRNATVTIRRKSGRPWSLGKHTDARSHGIAEAVEKIYDFLGCVVRGCGAIQARRKSWQQTTYKHQAGHV